MLPAPVAIVLAVLLVVTLFFVTRAGRARGQEGDSRRPVFAVEAVGLLALLGLLLAALWVLR